MSSDKSQWKNPRATGISFACSVLFIFAGRYVNIVRYIFKLLWVTLGCTYTIGQYVRWVDFSQ